jgi:NADPH-dependent glutamate synthase beta subunit-like oxidoreductase
MDTKQAALSPCTTTCPAGVDTRTNHYLIQQGFLKKAAENFQKNQPFPSVTGRVCFYPCENACQRRNVDKAVNINGLEQFMGDFDLDSPVDIPVRRHISKVAVVGSGPAGLSCAYFLARKGYPVTVYETMPLPGGMLRYGIPAYRLPQRIVDAYVNRLETMGVAFRCNTRIGRDADVSIEELKNRGFKSIMLAPGANASRKLKLEGASLEGVAWGLEFLRSVRTGETCTLSGVVLVIGGGDVAMDAAISAKRLGAAQVHIACLEACEQMPAYPQNKEFALRENIIFHYGCGPSKIVKKDGKVGGLEFVACTSVFDEDGCFCPAFNEEEKTAIVADHVIFAVGQYAELEGFASDVELSNGLLKVMDTTQATSGWGIFAAGDAVTGPASVVQAIAGGRECAESIDRMLKGADLEGDRAVKKPEVPEDKLPGEGIKSLPRQERCLTTAQPEAPFTEIRKGLDLEAGFAEALRCMTCGSKSRITYTDDCMTCFGCELNCPSDAIYVHPFKERFVRTMDEIKPASK